jgi:hypothetical protein
MYLRYYFNWHHQRFDEPGTGTRVCPTAPLGAVPSRLEKRLDAMDSWIRRLRPLITLFARALLPLSDAANPLMRLLLPVVEPVYLKVLKRLEPALEKQGKTFVQAVVTADPAVLDCRRQWFPN